MKYFDDIDEDRVPAMLLQGRYINKVASLVSEIIPSPWGSFVLQVSRAGKERDERLVATRGDERLGVMLRGRYGIAVTRLADVMYQPGKGTWFEMRLTAWSNGRVETEFNYDDPPKFLEGAVPLPEYRYLEEQEMFPRDEEHTPDWLREKVKVGLVQDAEIQRKYGSGRE